jgi:hypothetical protein
MLSGEVILSLVAYLEANPSSTNLGAPCRLLQTLAETRYSSTELDQFVLQRLLKVMQTALVQRLEMPICQGWDWHDWQEVFSLATSCYYFYRTYRVHVLSSSIIPTLQTVADNFSKAVKQNLGTLMYPNYNSALLTFVQEVEKLAELVDDKQV